MNRIATAVFAVTCLTVVNPASAVLAEEISLAGSSAMAHALLLPNQEAIEERAGLKLSVRPVGSLRGLRSLVRDEVDIAMTSAPLSELTAQLDASETGALDGLDLVEIELGSFRSILIVHPSNPVRSLSAEKAFAVLTGQTKNWQELGGPDRPIEVIVQPQGGGVRNTVERGLAALGGTLAPTSEVQTLVQVTRAVSVLPYAIGIASLATMDRTVAPLRSNLVYEQPMYLVTRSDKQLWTGKVISAAVSVFDSAESATWAAAEGPQ